MVSSAVLQPPLCFTQLDFLSGAIGLTDSEFSEGVKREVINTILCAGNESSVLNCPISFEGLESCGQFEDAGIVCQGKLDRF